jgi:hypothetical protein
MKLRTAALTLAVLYGAVACGDSTEPEDIAGTYVLSSIAGIDLPTPIPSDEATVYEVLSGTMLLTGNDTFTMNLAVRLTLGGVISNQSRTEVGQFTVSGSSIEFSAQSGAAWTGSVSDHWLTTVVDGVTWVWER